MAKAIMGIQRARSFMKECLNNYRFNRSIDGGKITYEEVNTFIPMIVPLGYKFHPSTREKNNNCKVFLLTGSNCKQVGITFQGEYDNIEFFN